MKNVFSLKKNCNLTSCFKLTPFFHYNYCKGFSLIGKEN